jgi:enterochelin esterase-like enzyme
MKITKPLLFVLTMCISIVGFPQDASLIAPEGFDKPNANNPQGEVMEIMYPSKTVGIDRKANIYLPPNYSPNKAYPVLYLLHGIGGDEREWLDQGTPEVIMDNLYAKNKAKPMIIVIPNGRAMKNDRAEGNFFAEDKNSGICNL